MIQTNLKFTGYKGKNSYGGDCLYWNCQNYGHTDPVVTEYKIWIDRNAHVARTSQILLNVETFGQVKLSNVLKSSTALIPQSVKFPVQVTNVKWMVIYKTRVKCLNQKDVKLSGGHVYIYLTYLT